MDCMHPPGRGQIGVNQPRLPWDGTSTPGPERSHDSHIRQPVRVSPTLVHPLATAHPRPLPLAFAESNRETRCQRTSGVSPSKRSKHISDGHRQGSTCPDDGPPVSTGVEPSRACGPRDRVGSLVSKGVAARKPWGRLDTGSGSGAGRDGERLRLPVGDQAEISIGSHQVFTSQPPWLGAYSEVSAGIHAIFDLGPLLFWILAVPVRLDPNQGVLWGSALACGVALSLAIEAVWLVKGWPACVAVALVVADVSWQTRLSVDLEWNPHIGLVFLIAAAAIAWAVATGRFGWWPFVVLFGSIAAQCHFIYVVPACALVVISPLSALAFGQRPSRWRWFILGLITGAACWLATLAQEVFGHPGNLTLILNSGAQHPRVGLGFGLHALAMAATPHPVWLTPYPFNLVYFGMPAHIRDQPIIWGIIALIAVTATAVIAWRAKRYKLAALAIVGTVMAIGTAVRFTSFPADNLTETGYLVNMMWVVGMLIWIIATWACLDLGRACVLRLRSGSSLAGKRVPLLRGLEVASLFLLVIAGITGVRALNSAATRAQSLSGWLCQWTTTSHGWLSVASHRDP